MRWKAPLNAQIAFDGRLSQATAGRSTTKTRRQVDTPPNRPQCPCGTGPICACTRAVHAGAEATYGGAHRSSVQLGGGLASA